MDNVSGQEVKSYSLVYGEMKLIRGDHAEFRILVLPPPLVPNYSDVVRSGRRDVIGRKDDLYRRDSDDEQDHCGDDGPGNLEPRVPVDLAGEPILVCAAIFEDEEDERALHAHENDCGEDKHEVVETLNHPSPVRLWEDGGLRGRGVRKCRAACRHQGKGEGAQDRAHECAASRCHTPPRYWMRVSNH